MKSEYERDIFFKSIPNERKSIEILNIVFTCTIHGLFFFDA